MSNKERYLVVEGDNVSFIIDIGGTKARDDCCALNEANTILRFSLCYFVITIFFFVKTMCMVAYLWQF